jgi:hypothetical protein
MPRPVGEPSFSIVTEPQGDPALAGFSTGSLEQWERDTDGEVERLYDQGAGEHADLTTLVMTDQAGTTLGVIAWFPQEADGEIPPPDDPWDERIRSSLARARRVHVIGISEPFRNANRDPEAPHLGTLLLKRSLFMMRQQCLGTMPAVWANVTPGNTEAQMLFRNRKFSKVRPDRYFRAAASPIR